MKLIETDFKAWLDTKKPDDIVGKTRTVCSCPLATYLREQTGYEWFVCAGSYFCGEPEYSLPEWAESFMNKVDKAGTLNVSANEALKYV